MGRRGPPPQPTALKLLRGNPGKRALNKDEPKPEPLKPDEEAAKCPKELTGDARAVWKRMAPGAMRVGLLTTADLTLFEAFCMTYMRWRQAERLTQNNLELAIAKGYRNTAVKERQLLLQFSARFGFDPSSRSNVKVRGSIGGTEQPKSKVDQFRASKTGA